MPGIRRPSSFAASQIYNRPSNNNNESNLESLENVFNTNRIIASKGFIVFVINRKNRVLREIPYENCGISITSKLWGASRKMSQLYVYRPVKKSKKQKITIGVEDHDWSSQDAYENEKKAIRLG